MAQANLSTVGGRVRYRRNQLGLTQVQLSAKAGIGQSAISSIENDETKWQRGPNLLRLALALEVDAGWLQTGAGQMSPSYDPPERAIADIWSALTPQNRRQLLGLAGVLLAEQTGLPGLSAPPSATGPTVLVGPSPADPYPHAPIPPLKPRQTKKTTR